MNFNSLVAKVRNVNFFTLCNILFVKIYYITSISVERIRIKFNNKPLNTEILLKGNNEELKNVFKDYYSMCVLDGNIVKEADLIILNRIKLFSKEYHINEDDWLKDPISCKYWDNNCFFYDAKVEEAGLGDVKFVMELNKLYHLVVLARAYSYSNNEKYIRAIKSHLDSWTNNVCYERSVVNKSLLDVVYRCINLIHISFLCFDNCYFKSSVFPLITNILIKSERQLRKFSTPKWCKYSTGANHTIGEMAGLIVLQKFLTLFTNFDNSKYLVEEYEYLNNALINIITPKGVYLEQSSNYSRIVCEFLIMLDLFNTSLPDTLSDKLYEKKYLSLLLNYLHKLKYHNYLPNFGDNDGGRVVTPFYDKEYSCSYIDRFIKLFSIAVDDDNLICEDSGQFIWRSKDELDLYVFTRCGKHSYLPEGSGSHSHNDLLSLIINVKGKEFIIDKGTSFYNSGAIFLYEDRATSSHNTVSITNHEEANIVGKWLYGRCPYAKLKTDANPFSIFAGLICYGEVSNKRTLFYNDASLEVYDEVHCSSVDIVSISYLLSPLLNAYLKSDNELIIHSGNELIATVIIGDNVSISINECSYSPLYSISIPTSKIVGTSKQTGTQCIHTKFIFAR